MCVWCVILRVLVCVCVCVCARARTADFIVRGIKATASGSAAHSFRERLEDLQYMPRPPHLPVLVIDTSAEYYHTQAARAVLLDIFAFHPGSSSDDDSMGGGDRELVGEWERFWGPR